MARQTESFRAATLLIRVVYFWFARNTLSFLSQFETYAKVPDSALPWPLFWHGLMSRAAMLDLLGIAGVLGFIFVMIAPGWRSARMIATWILLFQSSVEYAWGDVGHAGHAYFWTLFVLALAPSWRAREHRRAIRQRVLVNFGHVQLLLALFYFLSGAAKLLVACQQLLAGTVSAFHWTGMARILAARLLLGNTRTVLGGFLIDHPGLSYSGFWTTVVVELSSLWVLLRPSYHRVWGMLIVSFHLMMVLSLSPNFVSNIFLVMIFFVLSPIVGADQCWREWLSKRGFHRKS
jgi:hypothetical protein